MSENPHQSLPLRPHKSLLIGIDAAGKPPLLCGIIILKSSKMERKTKIVALWTLTLAGFLAHSLTDAMPAFWGESIAAMTPPASVGMISFMMLLTYTVPAVGVLLVMFGGRKCLAVNVVLACIMAAFTVLHMSELIDEFNPAQLLIMPLMAVVAILLARESLKIRKEEKA